MSDRSMTTFASLSQIVSEGYCIGCGGCAAVSDKISVSMTQDGQYRPTLHDDTADLGAALDVCPFSDRGPNEDVLGAELYAVTNTHDTRIGWYQDLYAGHVAEGSFRNTGASGGAITWILTQMFEKGLVDAVIHVRSADRAESGGLFQYAISRTTEEITGRAKSRYYPIEISEVMAEVKRMPGRYVFVGLPCFVKTVRRMAKNDVVIQERIVHTVGLVCGHLKSAAFSEALAWERGIVPGELEEIDFRVKLPNKGASDYGIYMRSAKKKCTAPVRSFLGGDWGLNFFRHSACDYCDDVFAESADVAVGDAWLPDYSGESAGNSVVVVRSSVIGALIEAARSDGRVRFDTISPDLMTQSQAGGLRDRREGLSYRLFLKHRSGAWAPQKRVLPSDNISRKRRQIYDQRLKLREISHRAWADAVLEGSFETFKTHMAPQIARMRAYYRKSLVARVGGKLGRILKKITARKP